MTRPKSAIAAAAVVVFSVATTATGIALTALIPPERLQVGFRVEDAARFLFMQVSLTAVGVLIVWRRPENRIGWLLSVAALLSGTQYLGAGYAVYGLLGDGATLPRPDIAAWFYTWSGGWLGIAVGIVALSFPDGRLRMRRAKVGAALAVIASALIAGFLATRPGPLVNFRLIDNPFGVQAVGDNEAPLLALVVIFFVCSVAIIVSTLSERLRRSTGDERQQLKWMLVAAALVGAAFVLGFPLVFVDWELAKFLFSVVLSLIPLSIGVAILRYHLYDIDVLINRTLVYGATSATLLGLYAMTVLVAQTLLRPVTQGSEIAIVVSTLAVAALVQPVRRRMQTAVDRRFYRSHYDAARTLDAFVTHQRDEVDLEALRRELLMAVRDTMRPAHASVWLRERAR
jgi:hypothetical protein